jgi:hypothetical protein
MYEVENELYLLSPQAPPWRVTGLLLLRNMIRDVRFCCTQYRSSFVVSVLERIRLNL